MDAGSPASGASGPRRRFEALARALAAGDPDASLAEAALVIAAEEYPDLDVASWLARLDALGRRARERIAPRASVEATAAALAAFLFGEEGFRGNVEAYYDPRNSFLNDVLDRRLGIPITLSLLCMEVASRAGVRVRGIALPGHFIVRLEQPDGARFLDPFDGGRIVTEADCAALVRRSLGPSARLDPGHLVPVGTREILARMLTNLKAIYAQEGDWRRALAAVDRILLLAPGALAEFRDRGGLHAKLGRPLEAIRDWETYLRGAPTAPDAAAVRGQLRALRQSRSVLN